jgi:bile acid:Na+ symporter, BASS family
MLAEQVYTVLLIAALLTNGIAVAGATPMRELFAPLRRPRVVLAAFLIDIVLVPAALLIPAYLIGLDSGVRAGLVLVAASSAGPIGIALTRMVRGDMPLAVTIVTTFGALNLITVPLIAELLLPTGIRLPLLPVTVSLFGLVIAPLLVGRAWGALAIRRGLEQQAVERTLARVGTASSVLLLLAVSTAITLDVREMGSLLVGPITLITLCVMALVLVGVLLTDRDHARRRTLAVVLNARGAGIALAVATLHLPGVPGVRPAVLAFSGLTQVLPTLILLAGDQFTRRSGPRGGRTTGPR